MAEIRFRVYPNYKEREVVERVAQIVTGPTDEIFEKDSGYKWSLDSSNDWWMDKDRSTGEFILAYRYGDGGNAPLMEALRRVIIWRLGIDMLNPARLKSDKGPVIPTKK